MNHILQSQVERVSYDGKKDMVDHGNMKYKKVGKTLDSVSKYR